MPITRSQTGKSVSKKEKKISKVMREFKNKKLKLANLRKRLRIGSKP
tara:strand:- start:1127 stop:1267 length:141 start_codon:yes stop_codon:yes gene_type:complete